jgi:hypothetical protein
MIIIAHRAVDMTDAILLTRTELVRQPMDIFPLWDTADQK